MKKFCVSIIMSLFLLAFAFATDDVRLLRYPDINKDLIAFVYAGDIWTVPSNGGNARRLTSHEGLELFPKISPDGQWIAFSGEYSGTRQIFVMPSPGGIPQQLTYYNDIGNLPPRGGFDHIPLDWTPDSRQILFRANRTPYEERKGKYFLVSIEGGLETPLQIPEGSFGSFSPDAKCIVYSPIDREFRTWKRYKGGRAQDIWIYDLVNNTSEKITDFNGTDQHPTWYKDKIFFVSDRDLKLNFWAYDLKIKNSQPQQITHHKEWDVLWPSGHGGQVAYENGGYIYVLDLETGETRKLTVNLHFDNPNCIPYFKNVSSFISTFGADISPTGKEAVFDARGDIFTVPAKTGITMNFTRTQGVREMYPTWSPDGRWIAYISDETGDYEIYLLDPQKKNPPLQLTQNHKVWKISPTWSPNSNMLLFYDIKRELQILDIRTKKITVVDKGFYDDITDYRWSRDSQWVVYSKEGHNHLTSLWVYSLEKGKAYPLTNEKYNDSSPTFSRCGKYIFFISDRDFDVSRRDDFSSMEFDFVYTRTARMYALALTIDAPDLFKEPESGEEKAPDKEKDQIKPITIDLEGIENRVTVFPLKKGNYNFIADIGGQVLYGKDKEYYLYDLQTRKDEPVIKEIDKLVLAAHEKKLLYQAGEKWGIIDIKPGQKAGDGELKLDDLVMKIDPGKEWQQIYNEVWRIFRDWFYAANMHGVDWQKLKEKYAPLLPYVSHRVDLDYIFGELVSELNVGHAYVEYGDFKKVQRMDNGLLGAELTADKEAGRYKISKIYQGENWNEYSRSPLTEPGVKVKVGDYLIRLNDYSVSTRDNPYRFLENTAGKKISITVNATPTEAGAQTYWIKPIKCEKGLFYLDWVNSRRKMVDQLSKGRIAYIHVPDTALEGHREFFKGLYAYSDKEAFIIDERYNGGGWVPMRMIDKLAQRPTNYWFSRDQALEKSPTFALEGPMVMLINYSSASGGDDFPYLFKKYRLGKLIGTRTWGGLVGIGFSPELVDGPSFGVPGSAFVDTDGEFAVEGIGVSPDEGFEVIDRPEEIVKGKDPSIEAAVKYLLEELEKNPSKKTQQPPSPDRSKWHEKFNEKEK